MLWGGQLMQQAEFEARLAEATQGSGGGATHLEAPPPAEPLA